MEKWWNISWPPTAATRLIGRHQLCLQEIDGGGTFDLRSAGWLSGSQPLTSANRVVHGVAWRQTKLPHKQLVKVNTNSATHSVDAENCCFFQVLLSSDRKHPGFHTGDHFYCRLPSKFCLLTTDKFRKLSDMMCRDQIENHVWKITARTTYPFKHTTHTHTHNAAWLRLSFLLIQFCIKYCINKKLKWLFAFFIFLIQTNCCTFWSSIFVQK